MLYSFRYQEIKRYYNGIIMKITPLQTGTIETWMRLHARPLKYDKETRISVPIQCYLLEHNHKRILFDAGQKPLNRIQDPLEDYVVKVKEEEFTVNLLKDMGITEDDLDCIILSHAHEDHFAGLIDFPHTKVIAQRAAAEILQKQFANEFVALEGDQDILDDGSIRCLATPGHAPGHQSLLVRLDDGSQILLLGDVIYLPAALEYEPSGQEYAENPEFFDSIRRVRSLCHDGVTPIYGHDPYTPVPEGEGGQY